TALTRRLWSACFAWVRVLLLPPQRPPHHPPWHVWGCPLQSRNGPARARRQFPLLQPRLQSKSIFCETFFQSVSCADVCAVRFSEPPQTPAEFLPGALNILVARFSPDLSCAYLGICFLNGGRWPKP